MKILDNSYNICTTFLLTKIFSIDKTLIKDITKSIDLLIKFSIDFLLTEKIKDDKTTGQIAVDYVRFIRVIYWVCKDFDKLLYCMFGSEFNIKNYNSKICRNYLSQYNIES